MGRTASERPCEIYTRGVPTQGAGATNPGEKAMTWVNQVGVGEPERQGA